MLSQRGHEVIELRNALPVKTKDADVLGHAHERGLFLITCNRDDFLALASDHPNPGLIILIRRRTRQAECAHLLALLMSGFRRRDVAWRLGG